MSAPANRTPRRRVSAHGLDAVRLALSVDPGGDGLTLEALADYGPFSVPMLGPDPEPKQTKDARGELWLEVERERELEGETRTELANSWPLIPTDAPHRYRVHEEDLFVFAKSVLPELEYRYTIEASPETRKRLSVEQGVLGSSWKMREGQGGWFEFSVDWHCKNAKLKREDVEDAIRSGRPYIRTEDGGFVEYTNTDELEALAEFLERSESRGKGRYASRLYFAPELAALLERSRIQQREETDAALEAFLDQAREGAAIEPVKLPGDLEQVLRSYQKSGVSWLAFLRRYGFGGILADDMGLGKTLQVLAFLAVLKEKEGPKPSLIICPKTLLLTWAEEAKRFTPGLSVLVVEGTSAERKQLLADVSSYDIVITSYSTLQRDIRAYAHLPAFRVVALDEAQYVKNAATSTAKAVKLVPAETRLGLTGTPLENGVRELWSIFDYLMPGFLGESASFRRKFERPIAERQDTGALEALRRRVRPFMLRRTKSSELKDLPPKIEQVSHSSLTPEQVVVYGRALEEVRGQVLKAVEERGFQRARIEILTALMKLRRICDHPSLVDPRLPRTEELSGKMEQCLELVRQAREGGHKVLLFSQFTTMLDILREALDRHGIGHCTIEGKTRDRDVQIQRFCNDASITVFLLSLRAGGTGLTLTEADTVILFDPWWNPMVERQAMDRAHRIGQTKTVNVYKLVTKGTVEEKVVALQERKSALFEALMQENPDLATALTWEDVQGLFE